MRRRLVAALGIGLVFALFFGLGEFALRIYTANVIFYDVEMTRYALALKERSENPKIGHVHRPGASARLMGVPVRINSDGFRDREYPLDRKGARRFIFLGDSLTFGWGVEESLRFESLLETQMNKTEPTEIVNFGTGNYNTEQEVGLFLEKGLKYEPDEVVVFFFINDAEPTPKISRWEPLGRSRLVTFLWSRIKSLASRLDESRSFRGYYARIYEDGQPGWTACKEAFLRLKRTTDAEGIGLKIVLLPELHDPSNYPFAEEHRKLLDFLARSGIDALDVTPAFAATTDPTRLWVALDDAHPNAEAHAIIAHTVEPFLSGDRHGAR